MANIYINDEIAAQLKQAAGISNYDDDGNLSPVPDHIAMFFERVQRRFNRVGGSVMGAESIALIVATAEMLNDIGTINSATKITEDWEDPEFSIPSLFQAGKIKPNDEVSVDFKGEVRSARILNVRQDRSQVQVFIEGDEIARWVHPRTVLLPTELATA
jgi:hypothetical protein